MASKKRAGDTKATKGSPSGPKADGKEVVAGRKRSYEYDHQYGLTTRGKAVRAGP